VEIYCWSSGKIISRFFLFLSWFEKRILESAKGELMLWNSSETREVYILGMLEFLGGVLLLLLETGLDLLFFLISDKIYFFYCAGIIVVKL
jgi:hypothetical protein